MKRNELIPVILSGGNGTRLWPLSRTSYPKQFLALADGAWSMLQQTARRLDRLDPAIPRAPTPMLVCNVEHRFIAAQQLAEVGINHARMILEPSGRNTAPALTLAALQVVADAGTDDDPVLLAMPADHAIDDQAAFVRAVETAWHAARSDAVVTFGVVPTWPETGYGYIRCGEAEADGVLAVANFTEKPDIKRARAYLDAGGYLWNSGLFALRASVWLQLIGRYSPDMLQACRAAMGAASTDADFIRPQAEALQACPAQSIDVAVMERLPGDAQATVRARVVPLSAGWSDLGSWQSLFLRVPADPADNKSVGPVTQVGCQGSNFFGTSRMITASGLRDILIVDTKDILLVADRNQPALIDSLINHPAIKEHELSETIGKTFRPWGCYEVLDAGPGYLVKRLHIDPHSAISLQYHNHRSEQWLVVQGEACVQRDEEILRLGIGQSIQIPRRAVHRLSNEFDRMLIVIEIQVGEDLSESDIVRLSDFYGRVD